VARIISSTVQHQQSELTWVARWFPAMAKKRKRPHVPAVAKAPAAPKPVFASPFKDLKKMLTARAASASVAPEPNKSAAARPSPAKVIALATPPAARLPVDDMQSPVNDDEEAFREAFAGVRPLNAVDRRSARLPLQPTVNHTIKSEDAEVIAQLFDLVSGQSPFDITETEEYVEGARVGLDPRLISRLRRGEFAVQSHLDLHGMIQTDAKEALSEFIVDSVRKGHRTVLVVHGRGRGSPGGRPVLKHAAAGWLSHGVPGGHVLAFTSARPSDGGAGATYVLLRRDRRRAAFDVLLGAKRRD
jgi:DNA-nicking Smr family endonuclease